MNTLQLNKKGVNGRTLNVVGLDGRSVSFPLRTPDSEPISPYIKFADPEVKRICVENWGSDGEITYEQAAAVTNLNNQFRGNSIITSFDELKWFTGLSFLNSYEFYQATALKSISLPDSIIEIKDGDLNGGGCFSKCTSLEEVQMSKNISKIGICAFFTDTALAKCDLPPTITYIGQSAFAVTSLTGDINLPNLFSIQNFVFQRTQIGNIESLGNITSIPDGNANTGEGVFSRCDNMISVNIPDTLINIGKEAFWNSGLQTLNTKNVQSIRRNAFAFNDLRYAILGSFTTTIEIVSFRGNPLETLICLSLIPPSLALRAFEETPIASGTGSIYVPDGTTTDADGNTITIVEAYKAATNWSTYAARIFPISQLQTDNPELYAEIEEYL